MNEEDFGLVTLINVFEQNWVLHLLQWRHGQLSTHANLVSVNCAATFFFVYLSSSWSEETSLQKKTFQVCLRVALPITLSMSWWDSHRDPTLGKYLLSINFKKSTCHSTVLQRPGQSRDGPQHSWTATGLGVYYNQMGFNRLNLPFLRMFVRKQLHIFLTSAADIRLEQCQKSFYLLAIQVYWKVIDI